MDESDLALSMAALAEATALHDAAVERGDTAMAQRFAPLVQGLRLLRRTEHWEEARDVLASLDRSQLPLVEQPGALAILAHVNVMAGDVTRGTELIVGALKEAEAIGADYPREKLLFVQGTYGLAQLLGGKPDEAIAILQPLMAIDYTSRLTAVHAYVLATAYLTLGRADDAKPWFEIAAAGDSPFAKRAQQALVGLEKMNEPWNDPASALAAAYKAAYERGDLERAEELTTMMRLLADDSPAAREMEKVGNGERLILSEKWAEARDMLASIDRSELPLFNRPGILNNLAYSTAQAGDPERAIELILQAQKEAAEIGSQYPQEKLTFLRGTHGISLSLAGKHDEAIAVLEPVVEVEHPVRARSTRAYYLGQSYRALGRTADAERTLKLAAAGEGPFAKRAEDALKPQN